MPNFIEVTVPGSIANLGPGFDVFAMSLNTPADIVKASPSECFQIKEVSGLDSDEIPRDPNKNTVTIAASKVMEFIDEDQGIDFKLRKGIPIERGIGSSGASAVAGAITANELFDGGLSNSELIEAAAYAEGEIAGSVHYDNVAASTVGGFVIINSFDPLEYLKIDIPPMKIVIASPDFNAPTKEGRKLLSRKIQLSRVSGNVGRASAMIAAIKEGDISMFAKNMIDDLIEPVRTSRIPGLEDAKKFAVDSGALGAAMSGAGPSVFAILEPDDDSSEIKRVMREAFEKEGVKCEVFDTFPGRSPKIKIR